MVDDNAFTNLMARLNLRYAVAVMRRLQTEHPEAFAGIQAELALESAELAAWERAAELMHVPYDPVRGITPQDATFLSHERWNLADTPLLQFPLLLHHHPLTMYRRQVLKQADVVMAMFLLGNEFSADEKRRNFDYYDPITTGDSSLSASIQSIVASEIGKQDAACHYLDYAVLMDLADVAGNASDGVHIASAAGAWMALVFGFGGVRDFDGQLTIDPRLPRRLSSLGFSLRFHDRQLRVRLSHVDEQYSLDEGDPLELVIRGTRHRLTIDAPIHTQPPAVVEANLPTGQ
jgi:alpha,alpha-trehalose phosphorylase